MSVIGWIIVGIIAGWLAEKITGRDHGLLTNLAVGIVGAFIGGLLFHTVLGFDYVRGINLASITVATVGAVAFLFVVGLMRGPGRRSV